MIARYYNDYISLIYIVLAQTINLFNLRYEMLFKCRFQKTQRIAKHFINF